jgi:hypothetical protein
LEWDTIKFESYPWFYTWVNLGKVTQFLFPPLKWKQFYIPHRFLVCAQKYVSSLVFHCHYINKYVIFLSRCFIPIEHYLYLFLP